MSGTKFGRKITTEPETKAINLIDNLNMFVAPNYDPVAEKIQADLENLRSACIARIEPSAIVSMTEEALTAQMVSAVYDESKQRNLSITHKEHEDLAKEIIADIRGLGPIQVLLDDDDVSSIMVNGPQAVYAEIGGLLRRMNIKFRNNTHLINLCQRIASSIGRSVDEFNPLCDARLRDGSRVNIVLPSIALDGAYLTIRKFRKRAITMEELVKLGSTTPEIAEMLAIISRSRLNFIISGSTNSGKTTLLNAMTGNIDKIERIITIEDAAELQVQHPHVVRMETRPPSREQRDSEVTPRDLVRNALRMQPDRIIIGEVRGAEAFDMLQAMNTGHNGSMSTIHANSAREAISRLENMVMMASSNIGINAIRAQIMSAINIIVQVQRLRDGSRRIVEIAELVGSENNIPLLNTLVEYKYDGETADGKIRGGYIVNPIPSRFSKELAYYELDKKWMAAMEAAAKKSGSGY